jgi:transposase
MLFGSDARLRVAPVDPGAWQAPERAERRRLSRTVLSLRIGSEGRSPIWAQWPMMMHRPLPEGSIVKRATVSVHRRGPREEWSVEITLEVPDESFVVSRPDQANDTGSAVAIDVGWRAMGGELRVATWAGSDGRSGELRLPESLVGAFVKVEELQAIRDQNFTAARLVLEGWLTRSASIPDWMHNASKSIAMWRGPSRLAALAKKWKASRFAGDEEAFEALEAWRYHDHHLWSWEASQRINALRARREIYRLFASQLVQTYAFIILENFDFRSTAESRLPDDVRASSRGSRRDRNIAAVSELRAILQNASAGHAVGIEVLDATGSADSVCPTCGSKEFGTAGQFHGSCDACGSVWDSHENAARGLLTRWQRECRGIDSPRAAVSSEQVPESRWVRARRLRAEKDAGAIRAGVALGNAEHKTG